MGKIIGIDLGTTNCCVAVLEGGTVQIVPNKEGGRTMPSVVGFTDKGERLVGQIAKRQAVTNSANTVYAVKRLIGRKLDSAEVMRMRATVPFEIVNSPNGDARVQVQGKVYSPPELSGIVLQRLKAAAEDFLGEAVTDAIITRSEEHTSELQSLAYLVCRLLLEKKNNKAIIVVCQDIDRL